MQDCLMKDALKKEHAKTAHSRSVIEEAGIEVLLRNPAAGMSEIALAAGVGRATLYRHFESRELLVQALANKCLQETDELVVPLKEQGLTGKEAIEAYIDVLMPMANRFRFLMSLWNIAADDPTVIRIYQRQLRELRELVKQAQDEGDICKSFSSIWVVSTFDALLTSAWQLIEHRKMSSAAAAAAFKRTFYSGCK